MQMGLPSTFIWVFLSLLLLFAPGTHQLRNYEAQVLLQLRKHLEYPMSLNAWQNFTGDFCEVNSPPQMSIKCENETVTELRIMGDKPSSIGEFMGYARPNQTLSQSFSIDSFVTTLTRLSSLRVLSLVSLGIWGQLPAKIHRLCVLEALDMSSNFMFGSIPSEMSRMVKIQSLTFDGNFFNDTVPEWLDSLNNLTILNLKNNRLKGQVPYAISRIGTLNEFVLSHNLLSGELPDLSGLSNLQLLDLRDNKLDSELPLLPKGLTNIFLSRNSFSGSIPAQFGKLNKLQHLDLSKNSLTGSPPGLLFSLPNISYLNLSSNTFSGSLPEDLKCGDSLSLVDISNNRLDGELPNCLDRAADSRMVTVGGNCFSIDTRHQHPAAYCKEVESHKRRSKMREIATLAGVIVGVLVILAITLVFSLVLFRRRYRARETFVQHVAPTVKQDDLPSAISSELLANARVISQVAKIGNQSAQSLGPFSVEELEEATKNFDHSTFLGEGSLGKVYKGRLENGTVVVIRELALHKRYSIRNLKLRLDMLFKLRHHHLVGLLGHCIDGGTQDDSGNRMFLVQEYVPNGNLRSHLAETSPEKLLTWSNRLAILIGAAKAVHFLHTGVIPPSLNNQLKTNNILIDEHGIAKLGDYGMSFIADELEKYDVGPFTYLDHISLVRAMSNPFNISLLKAKSDATRLGRVDKQQDDVYSFGFILLESLVGPVLTGKGEVFLLNEMTSFSSQDGRRKIVDPIVLTTSSQESLSIVISITNKCISPESSGRPSFEDVLWNLQYAVQVQATAEAEQKSDIPSYS